MITMNTKLIIAFVAGFASAAIMARAGIGRQIISGGNKFFN